MSNIVRQYVGARYTVKVYENSQNPGSAEWESNMNYEPLIMVTYNNGSYMSKKEVPANIGNPASNPSYWVQTGFYNGQIADLQNQIDNINNTIIPGIVNDFNTDIAAINGKLLRSQTLQDRKFLFLGDSYYLGGVGPVFTGNGWANQIINFWGLQSSQYILATVDDLSGGQEEVSTPAFYPSVGYHRSFKAILETIAGRLTTAEKNSITDIVVAGGFNDRNQGDDIVTGIYQYAVFAKANFPNAKLWCAHIGYSASKTYREQLLITRDAYRAGCAKYDVAYIDNAEFVLIDDDMFISDGIHPTIIGYIYIGLAMANALKGGGRLFSLPTIKKRAFAFDDTVVTNYNGTLEVALSEYGWKQLRSITPTLFTNHINIVANTWYSFAVTNEMMQATDGGYYYTGEIDFYNGTDNIVTADIEFTESGGVKYISIKSPQTISDVTVLRLPTHNAYINCRNF